MYLTVVFFTVNSVIFVVQEIKPSMVSKSSNNKTSKVLDYVPVRSLSSTSKVGEGLCLVISRW